MIIHTKNIYFSQIRRFTPLSIKREKPLIFLKSTTFRGYFRELGDFSSKKPVQSNNKAYYWLKFRTHKKFRSFSKTEIMSTLLQIELRQAAVSNYPTGDVLVNPLSDIQYLVDVLENSKSTSFNEDDAVLTKAVQEDVWHLAKDFLTVYAHWINVHYGILIDAPDISALPNGSIDILWYNKKGKILINIDDASDRKVHYYSDFHNKKNPMKGNVDIDSEIDESLAIRIKKLNEND